MKNRFLANLSREGKLELVEPSEAICASYTGKSENCLKSAKLLLENSLYENSIGMSYYAMYDALLATLFRAGIKCENHAGSILLLNIVFNEDAAHQTISEAKKERIDKQYYVTTDKDEATRESAQALLSDAHGFVLKLRVIISRMNHDSIGDLRNRFLSATGAAGHV
ncbi:MAG: HEPN domain-containing protein [Nanoarchaeota archaeon]